MKCSKKIVKMCEIYYGKLRERSKAGLGRGEGVLEGTRRAGEEEKGAQRHSLYVSNLLASAFLFPFSLWHCSFFLGVSLCSLCSYEHKPLEKFKREQPMSRVRGVSDLIQRGRPWVWYPWVQIRGSRGDQALGQATEKKRIVLVHILQVDLNQISWKGGTEVGVLFMFMHRFFYLCDQLYLFVNQEYVLRLITGWTWGREAKATSDPSGRNKRTSESDRGDLVCAGVQQKWVTPQGKQVISWGWEQNRQNWQKQQLSNKSRSSAGSQVQPTVWWQPCKAVPGCSRLGQVYSLPGNKLSGWLGPKCGVRKGATPRWGSVTTGVSLGCVEARSL